MQIHSAGKRGEKIHTQTQENKKLLKKIVT